jgi:hypothetical protein
MDVCILYYSCLTAQSPNCDFQYIVCTTRSLDLHSHLAYLPMHIRRLRRAIARDVNVEDLNDAMDYFLYVFHCAFSLGLDSMLPESFVWNLEGVAYLAQGLGPEVAGGLLDLVKEACFEIRSFEVTIHSTPEEFLRQVVLLHELLFKHLAAFRGYLQAHMAKSKGVQEAVNAEIDWKDNDSIG